MPPTELHSLLCNGEIFAADPVVESRPRETSAPEKAFMQDEEPDYEETAYAFRTTELVVSEDELDTPKSTVREWAAPAPWPARPRVRKLNEPVDWNE